MPDVWLSNSSVKDIDCKTAYTGNFCGRKASEMTQTVIGHGYLS